MNKRQLFLIVAGLAGTVGITACPPGTGLAECQISESNEDTGETYCPGPVTTDATNSPLTRSDEPEARAQTQRARQGATVPARRRLL